LQNARLNLIALVNKTLIKGFILIKKSKYMCPQSFVLTIIYIITIIE